MGSPSGPRPHRLFAATYDRATASAERTVLGPRRRALLAEVTGRVVDVGAGTGANLQHLVAADHVVAVEPDAAMRRRLEQRARTAPVPVTTSGARAEQLDLPTASADAVVVTLVLCSVASPELALAEAHRVLRPGGRLLLLEHVRATGSLARAQRLVDPLWCRLVAGCHVTRDTEAAVRAAGFHVERREAFRVDPTWAPVSPMIQLVATT